MGIIELIMYVRHVLSLVWTMIVTANICTILYLPYKLYTHTNITRHKKGPIMCPTPQQSVVTSEFKPRKAGARVHVLNYCTIMCLESIFNTQ